MHYRATDVYLRTSGEVLSNFGSVAPAPTPSSSPSPSPSPSPAPSPPPPPPPPPPAPQMHQLTYPALAAPAPGGYTYLLGTGWTYNAATDEIWATTRDSYYETVGSGFDDAQMFQIMDASTGQVKQYIPRGVWGPVGVGDPDPAQDALVYPSWMQWDSFTGAVFFVSDIKPGASSLPMQGLYRINADKTLGFRTTPGPTQAASNQHAYLVSWYNKYSGDLYLTIGYANGVVNPDATVGKVNKTTGALSASYTPTFGGLSSTTTAYLSPGEMVFTPTRKFMRVEVNGSAGAPVQALWGKLYEFNDTNTTTEVASITLNTGEAIGQMVYSSADDSVYIFCTTFSFAAPAQERVFRFDCATNVLSYVYDQPTRGRNHGLRYFTADKAMIPAVVYDSYRDVFWLYPFQTATEDLMVGINRATGAVSYSFPIVDALVPGVGSIAIDVGGQFGGVIVRPDYIAAQAYMSASGGTQAESEAYDNRQVYLKFTF